MLLLQRKATKATCWSDLPAMGHPPNTQAVEQDHSRMVNVLQEVLSVLTHNHIDFDDFYHLPILFVHGNPLLCAPDSIHKANDEVAGGLFTNEIPPFKAHIGPLGLCDAFCSRSTDQCDSADLRTIAFQFSVSPYISDLNRPRIGLP